MSADTDAEFLRFHEQEAERARKGGRTKDAEEHRLKVDQLRKKLGPNNGRIGTIASLIRLVRKARQAA